MRHSHVAAALTAVTAGLTVAVALHRRTGSRLPATTTATPTPTATAATITATTEAAPSPVATADREGVVLAFVRPVASAPAAERPPAPARCGDSGGRTKAGSPCAARATSRGRCHHHPVAA
jgi:hypothetical protein